jgi:hypothetical protein
MRLADRIRILLVVGLTGCFGGVMLAVAPPAPRIESIVLAPIQPHQGNPQVIWYDDFDADRLASYLEPSASSPQARRSVSEALGGAGQSMECYYPNGSQGLGNRKLVFGDSHRETLACRGKIRGYLLAPLRQTPSRLGRVAG